MHRSTRHAPIAVVAAAAVLLAPSAVRVAAAGSPVLESHAGDRPADADAILGQLATELAAGGFDSTRATARAIDTRLSAPARAADQAALDAAVAQIAGGYRAVVSGDFKVAARELTAGLRVLRAAPASVAGNEPLREAIMRALIGLSLSFKRLGDHEVASRHMADLIRSFPGRGISYKEYGPEPTELYKRVQRELRGAEPGGLTIEVDDPEAVVFVDERYVGAAARPIVQSGLMPGRYRVYVEKGGRSGRLHDVEVAAGPPTAVTLSWALDSTLHTDGGVAALRFADERERRRDEGRLAAGVARALGASSVALIGFREIDGRRHVVGQVHTLGGRVRVRAAAVALPPGGRAGPLLRALARYLTGDDAPGAGVRPIDVAAVASAAGGDRATAGDRASDDDTAAADYDDEPAPPGATFGGWKWFTLGVGALALGAGITLVVLDVDEVETGSRSTGVRDTAPAGYVTGGVGAVVTGLAIYMFISDARAPEPATQLSLVPTTGGALFGLTGRF